ncbi:hypothetical protein [Pseudooceanicola sp.]|uniref:hypothetical protein n=1 Tax=Pseudooceanicola sp. TaxID=1914328 RepID=UPI0035C6E19E
MANIGAHMIGIKESFTENCNDAGIGPGFTSFEAPYPQIGPKEAGQDTLPGLLSLVFPPFISCRSEAA